MTVREAAEKLGVNEQRVRAMLKAGRLQGTKHGRDWWIEQAAVDAVGERHAGRPRKEVGA